MAGLPPSLRGLLRSAGAKLQQRLHWPAGTVADISPTLHFWANGGLVVTEPLRTPAQATTPRLAMVVQPDGDVLLMVPPGFGSHPDDERAARSLLTRVGAELALVTRGPLPGAISLLFLTVDLLLSAYAAMEAVSATIQFWSVGAFLPMRLIGPLVLGAGRWLLAGSARGWLADRLLDAARRRFVALSRS